MNKNTDKILSILKNTYPKAKIALKFSNPLELLVAVILSAQCTDVAVNKVTVDLFKKYKTLDDYLKTKPEDFEKEIKSTGFYRNKAKNILSAIKLIRQNHKGLIPNSMKDLLTLPGVARKTANIVLGNAYEVVEGIAVDTHVHRISQRLRLVELNKIGGKREIVFKKGSQEIVDYKKDADPNKIEKELMDIIPKKDWFAINYMIVDHGRAICKAQNPKCDICPLYKLCPVSRV